jgi:adenylate cyclase
MRIPERVQISIGSGLLVGVIALVVVTAALIHIPWSITARAGVTNLAMRLNEQLIENARSRMNALLDETVSIESTVAANIRNGSIDIDHVGTREFLLSFIERHPTITAIEIGSPDDHSLGVRRLGDGSIVAEETKQAPAGRKALRLVARFAPDGTGAAIPGSGMSSHVDYAVSSEFWFKQAFAVSGPSWSDVYRRADSGELAFTRVEATTAPDGRPAVVAATIELSRISALLETLRTANGGTVFLTNTYGELIASGDPSSPVEMARSRMPSGTKLAESPSPLARIAAKALSARGVSLQHLKAARQIAYRPDAGENYYITISPLSEMGLIVGLVVPESGILGDIDRNTMRLAYLLLAFILVTAAIVAALASWTLGRPLAAVTRNTRLLGDFRFEEIKPVHSRLAEIGALSQAIGQMSASLASFRKYVPTELVRMLFAEGIEAELGGARRELSILFMDLAHFTSISEALGDELIPFLGEFLSEMSDELKERGGTIDKYIGDAIMTFWGAPVKAEDHALSACRAALACQARLGKLRARIPAPRGIEIRARIGINTGWVLVGNVGSRDRLNYTAIGDPVNVASRLESLNKRYGSEILIGEDTYLQAKDHIVARRLDRVAVYGKAEGVQVYELLGLREDAALQSLAWLAVYEEGVDAVRARDWARAETCFRQAVEKRESDVPSRMMLERSRAYRETPPPDDWDGLLRLSEK